MLKRLSGYTDDQLTYLLARVREVAALGDEAALIETDKFAWEIMDGEFEGVEQVPAVNLGYDTFEYYKEQRLRRLESTLKNLREKLNSKTLGHWELSSFGNGLREEMQAKNEREHTSDAWNQLRDESVDFLDRAWQAVALQTLDKCAVWEFKNVNSVGGMITRLKEIIGKYAEHQPLTEEMVIRIREVKERGARFRWNKKIGDAEVAKASGFIGKAEGLRREAVALLAQDWAMVFDDEKAPETSTTN